MASADETLPFSVPREQPDVAPAARMRVSRHAPAVGRHVEASILAGRADHLDNFAGSVDPGQIQIAGLSQRRGRRHSADIVPMNGKAV